MTLADFLLARIAEDAAWAEKATAGRWKLWGMQVLADPIGDSHLDTSIPVADTNSHPPMPPRTWNAEHIRRWDPTRVLAECEAKRRLVKHHETWQTTLHDTPEGWTEQTATAYRMAMEYTVQMLTLPYADHLDYQPEWRP